MSSHQWSSMYIRQPNLVINLHLHLSRQISDASTLENFREHHNLTEDEKIPVSLLRTFSNRTYWPWQVNAKLMCRYKLIYFPCSCHYLHKFIKINRIWLVRVNLQYRQLYCWFVCVDYLKKIDKNLFIYSDALRKS